MGCVKSSLAQGGLKHGYTELGVSEQKLCIQAGEKSAEESYGRSGYTLVPRYRHLFSHKTGVCSRHR